MIELKLKAGPALVARRWEQDEGSETGEWVDSDFTSRANEFLFDDVEIEEGFTLADLFGLLEACPDLQKTMRRNFCEELVAEARKGVSPTYKAGYDPHEVEYLELYQIWRKNTMTLKFQPTHRLSLHGVGYELREPLNEPGSHVHPAGHRIQWSVSCSLLGELLPLPIKLKTEVIIREDDLDARLYGKTIETVTVLSASLGQILHGVLFELSFYGGPDGQAEVVSDLKNSLAEIESATADLVAYDHGDVFGELHRPGINAMFDSIGDHKISDVTSELRALEDDEPVAAGLAKTFLMGVVVKPEFADLGARAFRKLFREAKSGEA